MTQTLPRRHHLRRVVVATIGAVWLMGALASAQSTSARALYERAQNREAAVRAARQAEPKDIRAAISAYELVVRRFPSSGYSDNSLWQAAGLALLSFQKTGAAADKVSGEHLLTRLSEAYPHSSLVKQVPDRRREFSAALPVASAPVPTGAGAVLRSISRESLPGGDRIVLEVDREVLFTSDRIANPDRVWIDLSSTSVGDGVMSQAGGVKGMMITGVRLGKPAVGTTRIVLDLAGMPKHSIYPLYGPYRLVIDAEGPLPQPLPKTLIQEPVVNVPPAPEPTRSIEPVRPPAPPKINLHVLPAALPPALTKGGDYSLARQLGLGVQRTFIDPGQCGHGPGPHG